MCITLKAVKIVVYFKILGVFFGGLFFITLYIKTMTKKTITIELEENGGMNIEFGGVGWPQILSVAHVLKTIAKKEVNKKLTEAEISSLARALDTIKEDKNNGG